LLCTYNSCSNTCVSLNRMAVGRASPRAEAWLCVPTTRLARTLAPPNFHAAPALNTYQASRLPRTQPARAWFLRPGFRSPLGENDPPFTNPCFRRLTRGSRDACPTPILPALLSDWECFPSSPDPPMKKRIL